MPLPAAGYIRQAQLLGGALPFSASTLWRKVRAGEFPAPVKLSAGVTAWKVEDVRAWMEGRSNEPHASVSEVHRRELPMKPKSEQNAGLQEHLAFEVAPENAIAVPAELTSPHRLVVAAAKEAATERAALFRSLDRIKNPPKPKPGQPWEPDWEALNSPDWRSYEDRGQIMDMASSTLPLKVSIESTDRALRIWDALIKACEARGMVVSSGYRVAKIGFGTDSVGVRLSEIVELTKAKTNARVYQPPVRRPTGRLRIVVVDVSDTKFDDAAQRPLEAQLNDVMACIRRRFALHPLRREQTAEKRRRDEEAALIRERQRAEDARAAQLHQEGLERQRAERAAVAERERLLIAEAAAWRDAAAIRAYIEHLKAAAAIGGTAIAPALMDWLTWADAVADSLDPTPTRLLPGA